MENLMVAVTSDPTSEHMTSEHMDDLERELLGAAAIRRTVLVPQMLTGDPLD